jgi:hypothetical protein
VVSLHWWQVDASRLLMQDEALACASGLRSSMITSPRTLLLCTLQSKWLQNHTAWRLCASSQSSMRRGDYLWQRLVLQKSSRPAACRTGATLLLHACICSSAVSLVVAGQQHYDQQGTLNSNHRCSHHPQSYLPHCFCLQVATRAGQCGSTHMSTCCSCFANQQRAQSPTQL